MISKDERLNLVLQKFKKTNEDNRVDNIPEASSEFRQQQVGST